MILPSAVMDGLFEYFDTADLARLAQLNKAWRSIVYRKSVWVNKYWSLKNESGVILPSVPKDARHFGSPNAICFVTWLYNNPEFPTRIHHVYDSLKFIEAAKIYWYMRKCPCEIYDHHEPTDLLAMKLPKSMPLCERKRILARLVKPSTRRITRESHDYVKYLEHTTGSSKAVIWGTSNGITPNPVEKDSDDPLIRYRYQTQSMLFDRFKAVESYKERIYDVYASSVMALRRHGRGEFEMNDAAFEKGRDLVWTHAAFGLPA